MCSAGSDAGAYFVDPTNLDFEEYAKNQDFVLLWSPNPSQQRQLIRAWPFPDRYPERWQLSGWRVGTRLTSRCGLCDDGDADPAFGYKLA